MHARHRTALIAGILALGCFILRWPLENHIANPDAWGYKNEKGVWVSFRPPVSEGENFFKVVFKGGSGTPAIFAMLGGQRYVVANIIWNYADVLFHQGKPYDMVQPFESVVTLNPSFLEAWSIYGWHEAWNLNTDAKDPALKAKWLDLGESVYYRAVAANPEKPRPYFDLAWLAMQRKGDYEGAVKALETVVYNQEVFKPTTAEKLKDPKIGDTDFFLEKYWLPNVYANRLGYAYKKLAVIKNDRELLKKAIETYKLGYKLDPKANKVALTNAKDLEANIDNPQWWKEQQESEQKNRERFGMTELEFGLRPTTQFYEDHDSHNEDDGHDH